MGFKQIDENTVQDDEGNTYFSPFLNYDAAKTQTPDMPVTVSEPGSSETVIQQPPEGLPSLPELRSAPSFQDLPSANPGSTEPAPNRDFTVGAVSTPATAAKDARDATMSGDVAAFSAGGGVAKSDEDMAKILAGQGAHKAQTAKADSKAARITKEEEIAKAHTMGEAILKTADEYDQHVAKIQADSKARWDDWKKRNDQAASALVDPRHAFTSMGTLSKIGWAMQFLGAGLEGGNQVAGVSQALNKLVETDINAQKANIDNKQHGLDSEKSVLTEQDKLGKDSVADWYAAKNLRLTAVGKQLDAKIAEMGMPAAQAAGLLHQRDLIEGEIIKGQQHISDHFFEQGQKKSAQAHDIYMARLQSRLRMAEDAYKEQVKAGDKIDTLPTNTQLGLQMVDKATGQKLEGGKIPLKVKGEKAIEAGQVLSAANEEASQIRDVKQMMKGMSALDIARGGTPEFASVVKELIQARAVRYNGHRLSDKDVEIAAQQVLGVQMHDGVIANVAGSIKTVGDYKAGIEKALDRELRNLSTQTVNRLHPYIDSDTAQNFDIQYNLQETNVPEVNEQPDDLNTAISKAAAGADTKDLQAPGPRAPVTTDNANISPDELKRFEAEKSKGRGLQGGLPRLQTDEEAKIEKAAESFTHAPVDDILRLSKAYLRDKNLSEEAKHEIRLEAQEAMKESAEIEKKVREEAMRKYTNLSEGDEASMYGVTAESTVTKPNGDYTEAFQRYLDSDMVNEMRRRAGLEARPR